MTTQAPDRLLMPYEVAERLRVSTRTVARWARRGLIECVVTPGGQRRYPEAAVLRLAASRGGNSS